MRYLVLSTHPQERRSEKIVGWGLNGSEGETLIRVLLGGGANPRNRFLNNYKAEFALKQRLICGAKLAYVHYVYLFLFFVGQYVRN